MNKEYERVSDKELNGAHKCSVCELSGVQCSLDYQEDNNMGNCNLGYYFKEVLNGKA